MFFDIANSIFTKGFIYCTIQGCELFLKDQITKKTTTMKTTLETICAKYCAIEHNGDNYSIGGGLDRSKFASRRHEDARDDGGKLTLGEATQLFKRATGLETEAVREILEYAVPNMEWHHAGKLPKAYGGGMKKTYFLNAAEICDCAKNWDAFTEKLSLSKSAAKEAAEIKKGLEERKLEFLQANAKRIERVGKHVINLVGFYFYKTAQEMNGKYGWFDSTYKNYNMDEYFSGWQFDNEEKYSEFINLK